MQSSFANIRYGHENVPIKQLSLRSVSSALVIMQVFCTHHKQNAILKQEESRYISATIEDFDKSCRYSCPMLYDALGSAYNAAYH